MQLPPRISIVTPCFNHVRFLEQCIESIVGQNYPNLDYVIMDGGSTDGSTDIIRKYEKYLSHWQCAPDQGPYFAVNTGFDRTDGEIMTWLNSDDILMPGSLETVADIFSQFSNIEWITGRVNVIDENGATKGRQKGSRGWTRETYLMRNYKRDIYVQQEGTFWRRTLWQRAGGRLDTEWKLAADFELWARFYRHAEMHCHPGWLAAFRKHANQRSSLFIKDYHREADLITDRELELKPISTEPVSLPSLYEESQPKPTIK